MKTIWDSFETGSLDPQTMSDAYKFCTTNENTSTKLRTQCENQERNTNSLMNMMITPVSLLVLKTSLNQTKSQLRRACQQEIIAAERLLFYITSALVLSALHKSNHPKKPSSHGYCIILQQNIRECSGCYQHSQYMNFNKNFQQIIFS